MNEPAEGWGWRKLYQALRDVVISPYFLRQIQNHYGIELRDVKRAYHYGTCNFIEMKNGDEYSISFTISKRTKGKQFYEPQSNSDSEIQP